MQNWILEMVRGMGPFGIGLLMLLENLFPPLPSEVIMPLAGFLSAQGEISFWAAVVAGVAGSVLGALFWYEIGRMLTRERLHAWVRKRGAWLAMTPGDVEHASRWFDRHGRISVLLGRLVPVVRTLISVPAGFSRMSLPLFLVLSTLGTAVWTGTLAYAGLFLGRRFHVVGDYIGWVSWVVVAAALLWYAYRFVKISHGGAERDGP